MPDLSFLMRSSKRRETRTPGSRCLNLFAEAAPTSPNADVVLVPFPGLSPYHAFPSGQLRGVFQKDGVYGGFMFACVGDRVWIEENDSVLNFVQVPGTVFSSVGRVQFAGDNDELMMVAAGRLYRIATVGGALSLQLVRFYDDGESELPLIRDIAYINGWFLYVFEGEQFGWSRVNDGDNLNALDFASAEYSPDGLVGLLVEREQVSLFGSETVESWVNTGDADAPFERRPGASFETGLIGPLAKCVADNSFVWVGADGIIYRMNDAPAGISTPSEEEAIARCEEAGLAGEISLWTFTWRGHPFIILDIPGEGSFAYDSRTGLWGEVGSWGLPLYRGFAHMKANGVQIIADRYAPRLLKLDAAANLDPDGTPVEYLATAHIRKIARNETISSVLLLGTKGLGANAQASPTVKLRTSIDGGETWGTAQERPLGAIGQRSAQAKWTKLGKVKDDGMVLEFSITDPVTDLRLDGVRFNA